VAPDFLGKLPYVSEALTSWAFTSDSRDRLRFTLAPERAGDAARVEEHIRQIAQKMCHNFREFQPRVLAQRAARPDVSREDPHPALEAGGELWRYGKGRYGFGPRLCALMGFFDAACVRLATERFGAQRYQFPSLIGADTLERCRYLKSFPHSLNLVSHLREDFSSIQAFASEARFDGRGLTCDPAGLAPPECLLSPSVCFHWYAWLAGQRLEAPRVGTALGKCFRYESSNLSGLERLWDFSMREIIFVGPREWVLAQRQQAVEWTTPLLDAWGLGYEVASAMDPFFVDDFAVQTSFQLAFDLKFEIRAALPYKPGSLAAGSFNYHQDFFGKAFDVSDARGQPVHTGCVAFGLERLALAFLAQHGVDPARWPAAVRQEIG
jgi:seryl-tRNA synthetase